MLIFMPWLSISLILNEKNCIWILYHIPNIYDTQQAEISWYNLLMTVWQAAGSRRSIWLILWVYQCLLQRAINCNNHWLPNHTGGLCHGISGVLYGQSETTLDHKNDGMDSGSECEKNSNHWIFLFNRFSYSFIYLFIYFFFIFFFWGGGKYNNNWHL